MEYQNYGWYLKTDLSKYTGNWIAIIDQKVIAYGKQSGKVFEQAKKAFPNKQAFLVKIENKLTILHSVNI